MSAPLPQRLAAEALGTGLLVAAVIGSGIMADRLTDDVALALLANTIATAAALFALITAFGPVSGAQFNPAVTLVFLIKGGMTRNEAAARVAVQVLGGLCGTLLAHAMFSLPLWQAAGTIRSGTAQCLAEGVATFGLVLSILGAQRAPGSAVAATVALYIAAAYWFTSSTSFANPAVTLARAFSDSFAGIRPADVPAFILAQLAGAVLAAGLAGWLFRPGAGTAGK
ncbi:aquaporin family protein [Tabrizicola sp. J26]|uniref:aquaporin n=1 Tax=Alitabrizicola rongguiensis TaxID=2909234 RepID=UPI001F253142|nr:MIP/aquaporin family protein [Tabrizicola rongguiensis]MCF1707647.1 aquaporin family protein [Tabrizicola rongguiensis]